MKVLIIENEKRLRDGLEDLINLFCPEVETIEKADGVMSGLNKLREYTPDILFMDVELDDGTGMDLLDKLDRVDFHVIFVTAHNKYAVDAFRYSALDFLLKPVDPQELMRVITKSVNKKEYLDFQKQFEILKEQIGANAKAEDKKIILKDQQSIYSVVVNDIVRCEAKNTYTIFYLADGSEILITKPLKKFEDLLEPLGFIRVHQSHLINKSRVLRFNKITSSIVIENGQTIPVSKRKKNDLLTFLNQK